MAEGINNKNFFLNFLEKINKTSENKDEKVKITSGDNNLFKSGIKDDNDAKKVLDSAEKYTKDKYGNKNFLDKLEDMEDYSDECLDIIDNAGSTHKMQSVKNSSGKIEGFAEKLIDKSSDSNKTGKGLPFTVKWEYTNETDEDGTERLIKTLKDTEGNIIKTETITTRTVGGDNPCIISYSEVKNADGKIISTRETNEDLKTGIRTETYTDRKGNSEFSIYDKSNNLISYKKTETEGSTVKTTEIDETGQKTTTIVSHDKNGYITESKAITSADGLPLYASERTEDPVHDIINESAMIYDEEGRPAEITTVETNRAGDINYYATDSYEYSEYKGNTADPTETVKINHTSTDENEENYTFIETYHLNTGKTTQTYADLNGKVTTLYDKDGYIVSEDIFAPAETGSIYGMSGTELIDFDNRGRNNEPGNYIRYEYDSEGNATITSAYHVDETGKATEFTESEKAHNYVLRMGYDGEVGVSQQQSTGDCWALSDLNSLSYSAKGREILEDALEYNEEGAIVHTYFGDYEISYEEIEAATKARYTVEDDGFEGNKYSTGDIDVLVFELATEKLRTDIDEGVYFVKQGNIIEDWNGHIEIEDSNDVLSGGWSSEMIYYLTGNQSKETEDDEEELEVLTEYMNNPDTMALNCAFTDECKVTDANGKSIKLHSYHAYAIKSFDGENVTIVNPWNSGKDIVLPASVFLENSESIVSTDLTTVEKDNGLFQETPDYILSIIMSSLIKPF